MASCPDCFSPLAANAGGTCAGCQTDVSTKWGADWGAHGTTCITMAGAVASGKSIYLAVLIKQLQHHAESLGMDVRPANPTVATTFAQHYLAPLYEQRHIMGSTLSVRAEMGAYQREPLVFVITRRDGSQHHLVIRDVAGEDLERMQSADQLTFFSRADAVFFLFDPLKHDEIRRQLRGTISVAGVGGDPKAVMDNTLHLVGQARPRLAVIMSKFDTLQNLRKVQANANTGLPAIMRNRGAAMFRDPGALWPGDHPDGEQLHEEVRSLLMTLRASSLVARVEHAGAQGGHRFFAVSALGGAPRSDDSLDPRGIAPFRVLDPLRWAMRDSQVLQ